MCYVKPIMYGFNIPYHYLKFDSTQPYFMAYCIDLSPIENSTGEGKIHTPDLPSIMPYQLSLIKLRRVNTCLKSWKKLNKNQKFFPDLEKITDNIFWIKIVVQRQFIIFNRGQSYQFFIYNRGQSYQFNKTNKINKPSFAECRCV